MTTQPISHQSPISEELATETIDGQADRRDVHHQSEPSRGRSSVGPRPPFAPTAAPSSLNRPPGGGMQPAMTHFLGDFASGQRTRLVPVVVVGTFATRRAASTSRHQ